VSNYYFCVGPDKEQKNFVVFNGDEELSDEPITDQDIEYGEITVIDNLRSMVWSCGCRWYFVIEKDCILLLNVYSDIAVKCKKRSKHFIDKFLDFKEFGKGKN